MRFDKYLTPQERVDAWRTGITCKLASMEVLPSEFNRLVKQASLSGLAKAFLYTALLTGIPVGGLAYILNDQANSSSAANAGLRKKRDYFRDLSAEIRSRLEENNGLPQQ